MKQNGVVCWPGAALLFFIFRFEYLISGPKSYRYFRETGPRSAQDQADLIGLLLWFCFYSVFPFWSCISVTERPCIDHVTLNKWLCGILRSRH